jgi:hypothetical protein
MGLTHTTTYTKMAIWHPSIASGASGAPPSLYGHPLSRDSFPTHVVAAAAPTVTARCPLIPVSQTSSAAWMHLHDSFGLSADSGPATLRCGRSPTTPVQCFFSALMAYMWDKNTGYYDNHDQPVGPLCTRWYRHSGVPSNSAASSPPGRVTAVNGNSAQPHTNFVPISR